MDLAPVELPTSEEKARTRRSRYRKSEKGIEQKRQYRHDNSKWMTDTKYLSRHITFIDSEGVSLEDGSHVLIRIAMTDSKPLINKNGLSTSEILRYIHSHMNTFDLNVIYGGSYDFNMWLKDVSFEELEMLYRGIRITLYGYKIKWIKGKSLTITRDRRSIVIYDTVHFFQKPFIDACDEYLGEYEGRDELVREKARRGSFTADELAIIGHYNDLEIELGERLITELRDRLNKAGLRPARWDGPGALATALFHREGIKQHLSRNNPYPMPDSAARAIRFAFAGGRFEMIRYGISHAKVYESDINSAYPAALTKVPSLSQGTWIHHTGDIGDTPFAVYRVHSIATNSDIPAPVFVRAQNGTVSFPMVAENWIWSPEMSALRNYWKADPNHSYRVLEVWEFKPDPGAPKPFAFVSKLYAKRQNLKAQKDGAQIALKLALNSMFGKLCQQIGWKPANGKYPERIPPYHELAWAGYCTSFCRAKVLEAAIQKPHAVIAFETDAIFTSEPLDLPYNEGLGAWELDVFDSFTYVQSGHYYARHSDGREIVRCRGIDKGSISRAMVERCMLGNPERYRILPARLTRFYGAGVAIGRNNHALHCRWSTEPKRLSLFPTGKRIHLLCDECEEDSGLTPDVWHTTICPVSEKGYLSCEFPIAWINPNPEMSELEELRLQEKEYEL